MFANLVESNPHREDRARKGSFFLGTLAIYALAFMTLGVGGIYAYNTQIESREDMEVISMITPMEEPEVQTPQRRAAATPRTQAANSGGANERVPVFKTRPEIVSNDPSKIKAGAVNPSAKQIPEGTIFRIGNPGEGASNIFSRGGTGIGGGPGGPGPGGGAKDIGDLVGGAPPPDMKPPVKEKPVVKSIVSGGVVNGLAKYLPKPAFPPLAKAAHAYGTVQVQVLIDEQGNVVSANAVSGHPLLLSAAVQAARQARFTPTLLSNQPVKVSGVITYNFQQQ